MYYKQVHNIWSSFNATYIKTTFVDVKIDINRLYNYDIKNINFFNKGRNEKQ